MLLKIAALIFLIGFCAPAAVQWSINGNGNVVQECTDTGEVEVFDQSYQTCYLNDCITYDCPYRTCYCEFNITSLQWEFDFCEGGAFGS